MADGRSVTIGLDLVGSGHFMAAPGYIERVGPSPAPPDAIPLQATPSLVVSLTQGCEGPLEALRAVVERVVLCHPCDEAIVRLLLGRVRRHDGDLVVTASVSPGTLSLGPRAPLAPGDVPTGDLRLAAAHPVGRART